MNFRTRFPSNQYPFSDELCLFMDNHPDFFNSLKLSNTRRFVFIPLIFTSHTPKSHTKCNDEVIGLWYLDKNPKKCREHNGICRFKQDFIVNINHENKEFISYSAQNQNGKYIKPIKCFFNLYGEKGLFYHDCKKWQHHYSDIADLPDEPLLKLLAKKMTKIYGLI